MFLLPFLALAHAAVPPSSTLTGTAGTLSWAVSASGGGVTIDGRSPKWTVHHVAAADLKPIHTERSDSAGARVTVDYTAAGAVVHSGSSEKSVSGADIWDGDTVDIRLGQSVAGGHADVSFHALDPASGSLYGFEARKVADPTCGAAACTQVHMVMTGVYRYVGPSWDYWYGADGRLLRFQGPIGTFAAAGAQ